LSTIKLRDEFERAHLRDCESGVILHPRRFEMKTATKVIIVLLIGGVALVAAQEGPRTYVADCICCLCSYLFGNS